MIGDWRSFCLGGAVLSVVLLAGCSKKDPILLGERIDVRDSFSGSVLTQATTGTGAQPITLSAMQNNADWAQRGGNAAHNAPHAALSAAPQLVWASKIGTGSSRQKRVAAAPVVAAGRVFTMDADTQVSATTTSGALAWQVDLRPMLDRKSSVSGGGLASDGTLVFVTTGYGEVIALVANSGAVLWRKQMNAAIQGAPSVAGGVVYVGGRDGAAWALNAADGKTSWQVPGSAGVQGMLGTAAPTVTDRSVIFPSGAGDLLSVLKIGGVKNWQESIAGKRSGISYAGSYDVTGDASLVGGTLYTGTAAGRTVALDAFSGSEIWSATEGAMGPVVVQGGSVFIVNDQAKLVRLNSSNGALIWASELPYFVADKAKKHKAIHAHYGPVLAGGRLWVASSDGVLRGFSPVDGSMTYQVELPGGAATQPAVAAGTLYVVSNNGQLLAFR